MDILFKQPHIRIRLAYDNICKIYLCMSCVAISYCVNKNRLSKWSLRQSIFNCVCVLFIKKYSYIQQILGILRIQNITALSQYMHTLCSFEQRELEYKHFISVHLDTFPKINGKGGNTFLIQLVGHSGVCYAMFSNTRSH